MSAEETYSPAPASIALGSFVPHTIAISQSGRYLLLADDKYIELVFLPTEFRYPTINIRDRGGLRCLKWSPVADEFFCAFDTGEIVIYRIDQEQERYAHAILKAMQDVRDGAISYDGRRFVVAGGSKVMVWIFVQGEVSHQDSWNLEIRDLSVDAGQLPDGPWEGRAQPLRVWWPHWSSDELFVAYANRGVCMFCTSGEAAGTIRRFIPTYTADSGRAIDLYASDPEAVYFARACPARIEIIELNATVVQHRIVSPTVNLVSTSIAFSPSGGRLLCVTHGVVTCMYLSGDEASCQQLLSDTSPNVNPSMTVTDEMAIVAPVKGNVLVWRKAERVIAPQPRPLEGVTTVDCVRYCVAFAGGLIIFFVISAFLGPNTM